MFSTLWETKTSFHSKMQCLFRFNHVTKILEVGVKQIKKCTPHSLGLTPLRQLISLYPEWMCHEHYRNCDNTILRVFSFLTEVKSMMEIATHFHIMKMLDTNAVYTTAPCPILHEQLKGMCMCISVYVCKFPPILQNLTPAVWSSLDSWLLQSVFFFSWAWQTHTYTSL